MSPAIEYASFLIRLWREQDPAGSQSGNGWHIEVEHVQSGQHWIFDTVDGLTDFFAEQTGPSDAAHLTVDE